MIIYSVHRTLVTQLSRRTKMFAFRTPKKVFNFDQIPKR